ILPPASRGWAWANPRSFASRLFRPPPAAARAHCFRPAREDRTTGVACSMKFPAVFRRTAVAALATFAIGLALAQDAPTPTPAPAAADAPEALPTPPPPSVTGTAWVLMDHESGQILAGENIDQRWEPASITEVVTSYRIAAEIKAGQISPDAQVLMTGHAWRKGGAGTDGSYRGLPVHQTAPLLEMGKG